MLKTADQALALVRRCRAISLMPVVPEIPSLVGEIAGGPIRGSWWGHPKAALIFNIAQVLDTSPEVLTTRLLAGRVSFVHRSLWPAVYRVVSDRAWRRSAIDALSEGGRELLAQVERSRAVRLDQVSAETSPSARRRLKLAKDELEKGMLVHAAEVHTEKGSHSTVLINWRRWVPPEIDAKAGRLSLEEALAEIHAACLTAPTPLSEPFPTEKKRTARR
jgi:hypothetical protein